VIITIYGWSTSPTPDTMAIVMASVMCHGVRDAQVALDGTNFLEALRAIVSKVAHGPSVTIGSRDGFTTFDISDVYHPRTLLHCEWMK
jgi:hypothetical protein